MVDCATILAQFPAKTGIVIGVVGRPGGHHGAARRIRTSGRCLDRRQRSRRLQRMTIIAWIRGCPLSPLAHLPPPSGSSRFAHESRGPSNHDDCPVVLTAYVQPARAGTQVVSHHHASASPSTIRNVRHARLLTISSPYLSDFPVRYDTGKRHREAFMPPKAWKRERTRKDAAWPTISSSTST